MSTDNLDFNFGTTGGIFGDFTPDLSSIQAKPKEEESIVEEKETETFDTEETEDQKIEDNSDNKEDNDSEDTSDVDTVETDVESVSYKAIADYLAESGIVDSIDDYDGEDTPEALEIAVQKTINNMVQHYKDSIPEEGKQFLNYIEKGGDPYKFFQTLSKPLDFNNIDLTDEKTQKKVYEEYLKSLDYTTEEIQEELNDAEDNLLLEKKANIAVKKLEKIYKDKQEELLKQQEQEQLEQQQQFQNYINQVKNTIETSNQLAGIPLTPSEKAEFQKYLLQVDSEGFTSYQRDLNDNPIQTQLELAYLKFKKYDFSKVSKQIKTEEAKRIKNLIKNTDKINSRSPQILNNNNAGDLSAFKSQLL